LGAYLHSRDWWVFLEPEVDGITPAIQSRFYSGEASHDFVVVLTPEAPIPFFGLGRKSRLSPGELARWLNGTKFPGLRFREQVSEAQLQQQDFVFLSPGTPEMMELMVRFARWLDGVAGQ